MVIFVLIVYFQLFFEIFERKVTLSIHSLVRYSGIYVIYKIIN